MTRDEADAQLAKAIADHAQAFALRGDDEAILDDYAVVAHWQTVIEDGKSRYTTHFTSQAVAAHVVVGLFTMGADLCRA